MLLIAAILLAAQAQSLFSVKCLEDCGAGILVTLTAMTAYSIATHLADDLAAVHAHLDATPHEHRGLNNRVLFISYKIPASRPCCLC